MASKLKAKPSLSNAQLQKTPVAVIGMASIFPQASNLDEYWENILHKIDCVMEVPPSRWNAADYYDPDPSAPDKTYSKRGGFLPDVDFDPTEFGLPPNILEVTDVSQLLGLVVARDALEDAGYGEERAWNRQNTGVILGVVGVSMKSYVPLTARLQYPVWEKVLRASGVSPADTQMLIEKFKKAYIPWEENSFPGALANVVSGRVANRFDLGATNCIIDAACATSLAATKMAIMELVEGRADMMITGGVDTDNSIGVFLSFSKTPAFSKGEKVRTFDAASDGMMAGEGIGMLVLKRLADAERDGDRIYAVIRGVGSSSDGRYKSIYAPRPSGQSLALRRAYQEAGYTPGSVGLIEAHGTGTPAGDPAEFEALREVFSESNPVRDEIALGSVKSQIAHTKGAAGAAGLIKVALALHHKVLPATINVQHPSPKLDLQHSPFYINTETRPWFRRDAATPRRAGVSAFGFGGTNFHLTLEEYQAEHTQPYRRQRGAEMVLLTASDPVGLLQACREALASLQDDPSGRSFRRLGEASLTCSLPAAQPRLGLLAETRTEGIELMGLAVELLQRQSTTAWEHPRGIYYRPAGMDTRGKVVALFSGQGSQYLEMGRELACNFPPLRQTIAEMDARFTEAGQAPLSGRIYPPPAFEEAQRTQQGETLTRTEYAQPAIGAFSVGLYRLLQAAGFAPDFVAGHSFGELTALWAAGVLSDSDYYTLAWARGQAMAAPSDPSFDAGAMLAVKGDVQTVRAELESVPEVTLANWNSDTQVVLAGPKAAMARVQERLSQKGFSVVSLAVSAAFHTPLVRHAQQPFSAAIDRAAFRRPKVRVFSNTSGQEFPADGEQIRTVFKGHMLHPVLWRDEIEAIYAAGGAIFVEFGPKSVLTNLVKSILGERPHLAVALNASPKKDSDRLLREAALQLRVTGLPLGNVDPWRAPLSAKQPRKNSPATVKLNGGLYLSPKTRAAFEQSLQDGWQVSSARPAPETPPAPTPTPAPSSAPAMDHSGLAESLAHLRQQQREVVQLHEQYLHNEEEYARIVARLAEQSMGLASNTPTGQLGHATAIFESLERSLARLHEHQSETLRVHARYLESQDDYARRLLVLLERQAGLAAPGGVPQPAFAAHPEAVLPWLPERTPVVASAPPANGNGHHPAPVPSAAAPAQPAPLPAVPPSPALPSGRLDLARLREALLAVASEKTGYPVEMLELDADIEADLGIDSIKRVEILGALREQFPQLPEANPEAFAEVHTLGQIVDYLARTAHVAAPDSSTLQPVVDAPAVLRSAPAGVTNTGTLSQALLLVVSEKTGYPVEMLELDADMEADLGIDSIKRVEILGALREQYPGLPEANPEAFAEVHTLGETVSYLLARTPAAAPHEAETLSVSPAPEMSAAQPVEVPTLDAARLREALLAVVSEKTGYPVEMLELDADMEADLGIDSIKRVEILGALREQFPQLPEANPEAFAEVHTLGQIVDYLAQAPTSPAVMAAEPEKDGVDEAPWANAGIARGVVRLKELPPPDAADFRLAEGAICLLADDGTPLTAALAQALKESGLPAAVLSLPRALVPGQAELPQGVRRFDLTDTSEAALESQLAVITGQMGPVGALIYLNPRWRQQGELYSFAAKQTARHAFLLAKHLQEPLARSARQGDSAFVMVTRLDGEFGLGSGGDFDPIGGGLFGLAKTVNLEWEAVFCRALDLAPQMTVEGAVRAILDELHDPNRRVTEVGYGPRGRVTLAADPETREEAVR